LVDCLPKEAGKGRIWSLGSHIDLESRSGKMDTVMGGTCIYGRIDSRYPATLSKKTVKGLLRDKIGFKGVIITDDLQMGAITKHFSLRDVLKLSIKCWG